MVFVATFHQQMREAPGGLQRQYMEAQSFLFAERRYASLECIASSWTGNPEISDSEVYERCKPAESVDSKLPVVAACSGVAL